jgi:hypothetical protein
MESISPCAYAAERPKLSDPAHEGLRLQPERNGRALQRMVSTWKGQKSFDGWWVTEKESDVHLEGFTCSVIQEPTSSHFPHFTSYPLIQCICTTIWTSLKYHIVPFLYGWGIRTRNNPENLTIALRQFQHNNSTFLRSKDTLGFRPGFRSTSKVFLGLPNDAVTPTTHRQEHVLWLVL